MLQMTQVSGQNEEGFNQGEDQYRNNDQADLTKDRLDRPTHKEEGQEHDDRRDHRKEDRLGHHIGPANRSAFIFNPVFTVQVNGFADHNGVIDHDPNHKQEGEQADHIQGNANERRNRDRAHKGGANPDRHPDRHFRAQEEDQNDQNKDHAGNGIAPDEFHPGVKHDRPVKPDLKAQIRRQTVRNVFFKLTDRFAGFCDIHFIWRENAENRCRFTIELGVKFISRKAVNDGRNIADTNRAALLGLTDNNVFKLVG